MLNLKKNWLVIWKWHEEYGKFSPEYLRVSKLELTGGISRILTRALESLKNFCFEALLSKYILLELKKYKGVIFHDIEEWCKIWKKAYLWFGKWHEEFGKCSPEHSKVSKLEFWWDTFFQGRNCMTLKFTEELCAMSMKSNAKFEEELT